MGKKVVTSIRIDQNILNKAKDIGLNVSKISENALKDLIDRIEKSSEPSRKYTK
jgi:post-segregation antitoxin (ccd killing protein)